MALNSLCGLLKTLPNTFKSYSAFCRKQSRLIEALKAQALHSEKSGLSEVSKLNAELLKANEMIYQLQAELGMKDQMIGGLVEKAISDIKNKMVTDFKAEKISLMDTINSLEIEIKESNKKVALAEEGRSSLLNVITRLENEVAILKSTSDPKIRRVTELAADDQDFHKKIMEAADHVECLDIETNPKEDPRIEKLKQEILDLNFRIKDLEKLLEDGADFIEILQKEIRELKTSKNNDKLQSYYGLDSEINPEFKFLSNPGLPQTASILMNEARPHDTRSPPSLLNSPVILTTWNKLLHVVESKERPKDRTNDLMAEIEILHEQKSKLENDLKSTFKYLADAKSEIEASARSSAEKDATIQMLKEDLSGKSLQLNICQAKLAELRCQLESHARDNYLATPLIALIDSKESPQAQDYCQSSLPVAPTRDISAEILKNKAAMQSTAKPTPSETEVVIEQRRIVELEEKEKMLDAAKAENEARVEVFRREAAHMASEVERLKLEVARYQNVAEIIQTSDDGHGLTEVVVENVAYGGQESVVQEVKSQSIAISAIELHTDEKPSTSDKSGQTDGVATEAIEVEKVSHLKVAKADKDTSVDTQVQTTSQETSTDQTAQNSIIQEKRDNSTVTCEESMQTDSLLIVTREVQTEEIKPEPQPVTEISDCYKIGEYSFKSVPKEFKQAESLTSDFIRVPVITAPMNTELGRQVTGDKIDISLKPRYIQEEESMLENTMSDSEMQSAVITNVKGAFDADSLKSQQEENLPNKLTKSEAEAISDKKIEDELNKQLEQIKDLSYYFQIKKEPQLLVMEESPMIANLKHTNNPFLPDDSNDKKQNPKPEMDKGSEIGKLPISSLLNSHVDPISVAQSMRNPYTNYDRSDSIPEEGSHFAPSKISYDMNAPRGHAASSNYQRQKSANKRDQRQFSTFNAPANVFVPPSNSRNPFADTPKPVDSPAQPAPGSAQSKLKNIVSGFSHKRPGQKQLDAISKSQ